MKKESIKDKFKRNIHFVKPLYRKAKIGERDEDKKSVSFDRTLKLLGDDINVKTVLAKADKNNVINIKRKVSKEYNIVLPGACDSEIKLDDATRDFVLHRKVPLDRKIISNQGPTYSESGKRLRNNFLHISHEDTKHETMSNIGAKSNNKTESKKTIVLHKVNRLVNCFI